MPGAGLGFEYSMKLIVVLISLECVSRYSGKSELELYRGYIAAANIGPRKVAVNVCPCRRKENVEGRAQMAEARQSSRTERVKLRVLFSVSPE